MHSDKLSDVPSRSRPLSAVSTRGGRRLQIALVLLLCAIAAGIFACSDSDPVTRAAASAIVSSIPFSDGERLVYDLWDDDGIIGRGTLSVKAEADHLVLTQEYEEAAPPEGEKATADRSSVNVGPTSLLPQSVERVVEGRDENDQYAGQYAPDGSTVTITTGSDSEGRTLELPKNAYENESSLWLWRTLPFAEGYKDRYVSVNTVEKKRQTVELEVTGQQKVTVPAGTFDTWRLQVRNGRATRVAWINVQSPHQVIQWDNGSTVFKLKDPPQ